MERIETDRCYLRRFIREDLPAFVAYRSDPEVARYQSWTFYTQSDAELFYAQQRDLEFDVDDTWFQIAIVSKESESIIGDVAVHFVDESRQAEIGFTIKRQFQRRGYAYEAVSAVIQHLFQEKNKHRLTAIIDVDNHRAEKLLKHLGFRREAHYVQNVFFKGKWSDEYCYALLYSERG